MSVTNDAVVIRLHAPGVGDTIWTFEDIEVRRKDFDCQLGLEVVATIPGFDDPFPPTHFTGSSASARDTFRRLLDGFYGKSVDWARLLPQAYSQARAEYLAASQSVDLENVELVWEEAWFVDNLWPSEGVTILFGQGSHGKGHITTAMSLALASDTEFLGRETHGRNILYLDYEATERVLARRLNRHLIGGEGEMRGRLHYMAGRAIPVADQIDAVRREILRTESQGLIVDSAIPAVGGDPSKPEVVGRMFNALNTLRIPIWLMAHVTKAGEDEFPFGSIFWHNLARMTWFIKKVGDEDRPDIEVAMFNRKINEGRLQKSFGAQVTFDDPVGPIRVASYEIASDPELAKGLKMPARLYAALRLGPKLTSHLAVELETTDAHIRVTAGRMKDRLRPITFPGEKEVSWARLEVEHGEP